MSKVENVKQRHAFIQVSVIKRKRLIFIAFYLDKAFGE